MRSPISRRLAVVLVCVALTSCQAWRTRNDGQHLDAGKKHHEPSTKTRTLQAEVTTNAEGEVANIRIVHSSGSSAVDDFVLESIRSNWPQQPSLRTVVEVSQSPATGFSDPKVISTAPAQ